LAGSHDFISKAWLIKRRWGGAMRQTGVLTAMCLYALDHHIDRLADDHALAKFIGVRLGELDIISDILPIDSNIVIADLADDGPDAREVANQLRRQNITITVVGNRRIRIVTHMDVGQDDADVLVAAMATVT
jgi:threonine aldolase